MIEQPTRLKAKTLIDNILINSLEYKSTSGNMLIEIADHLLQFLVLEGFLRERKLPKDNIFKRDLSKFSLSEFEEVVINGLNWNETCQIEKHDANLSFKSFYDNIIFNLDEMAPYKRVTRKEIKLMQKP